MYENWNLYIVFASPTKHKILWLNRGFSLKTNNPHDEAPRLKKCCGAIVFWVWKTDLQRIYDTFTTNRNEFDIAYKAPMVLTGCRCFLYVSAIDESGQRMKNITARCNALQYSFSLEVSYDRCYPLPHR